MGLDMYLEGRRFISPHYNNEDGIYEKLNALNTMKDMPIKGITYELAYWRKANEIHNWFVENVQDGIDECQESCVSKEQLEELLNIIEEVLADPLSASDILPTQSGFFFGGIEYDEYYFENLKSTKEVLTNILTQLKDNNSIDIYYHASW